MRRIGLVGAGFISRVHAEVLQGVPGTRITAIVDPSPAAARALAESLPMASRPELLFASVEEALEANAIDCAHVLVPPQLHAPIGRKLLEAGKPVLLEKPLGVSGEECRELVAASETSGPSA